MNMMTDARIPCPDLETRTRPKPHVRFFPARGNADHHAVVIPSTHDGESAVVLWYYKGERKVTSWLVPMMFIRDFKVSQTRAINRLRARLSRYNCDIFVVFPPSEQ